jgi:predicted site-specific integrase-resolvase
MSLSNTPQSTKSNLQKELLTREETISLLAISPSTLHRWCKAGKVKSHGIGGRVYYLHSEIMQESLKATN